MSNKKLIFIFMVVAPLAAVLMAGVKVYYDIQIWSYQGQAQIFKVNPGEGFSSINYRLGKSKLIKSTKIFHRYSQINGIMTKFKAGQYEIPTGSNMIDVISILTSGQSITTKVTIPEGKNLFQVAEILLEANVITDKDRFISLCKDEDFVKSIGMPGMRCEGYLYPETYQLSPKSKEEDVIKSLYSVFKQKVKDLDFSKVKLTPHEVVILASVVEKETGAKWERPLIAGVFHNRLKKRMRIQSDPTTIYGIWERYNGNLRKKDLLEKTPYNTYKIPALPIGPISNPGIESIKAVLEPEKHNFLYFVSKNDGTHEFTETYRQHREAVERFQKNRAARQGKSWRDLKQ